MLLLRRERLNEIQVPGVVTMTTPEPPASAGRCGKGSLHLQDGSMCWERFSYSAAAWRRPRKSIVPPESVRMPSMPATIAS
jgi:hypothetical protein